MGRIRRARVGAIQKPPHKIIPKAKPGCQTSPVSQYCDRCGNKQSGNKPTCVQCVKRALPDVSRDSVVPYGDSAKPAASGSSIVPEPVHGMAHQRQLQQTDVDANHNRRTHPWDTGDASDAVGGPPVRPGQVLMPPQSNAAHIPSRGRQSTGAPSPSGCLVKGANPPPTSMAPQAFASPPAAASPPAFIDRRAAMSRLAAACRLTAMDHPEEAHPAVISTSSPALSSSPAATNPSACSISAPRSGSGSEASTSPPTSVPSPPRAAAREEELPTAANQRDYIFTAQKKCCYFFVDAAEAAAAKPVAQLDVLTRAAVMSMESILTEHPVSRQHFCPPRSLAIYLLDVYRQEVYFMYPFFNMDIFIIGLCKLFRVEPKIEDPPEYYGLGCSKGAGPTSPLFQCALFMMLSHAAHFSNLHKHLKAFVSRVFWKCAKSFITTDLLQGASLAAVQAFLIIAVSFNSSLFPGVEGKVPATLAYCIARSLGIDGEAQGTQTTAKVAVPRDRAAADDQGEAKCIRRQAWFSQSSIDSDLPLISGVARGPLAAATEPQNEPGSVEFSFFVDCIIRCEVFMHVRALLFRPILMQIGMEDCVAAGLETAKMRHFVKDKTLFCATRCVDSAIALLQCLYSRYVVEVKNNKGWWWDPYHTSTAGLILIMAQTSDTLWSCIKPAVVVEAWKACQEMLGHGTTSNPFHREALSYLWIVNASISKNLVLQNDYDVIPRVKRADGTVGSRIGPLRPTAWGSNSISHSKSSGPGTAPYLRDVCRLDASRLSHGPQWSVFGFQCFSFISDAPKLQRGSVLDASELSYSFVCAVFGP
ncbi:hypothetical protein Trco_003574 [Trichoderma cornu-damae]|uniref:Transcription factor domain-containing protein n=1 Tax=Trichoderma cornu-damae TaxID=654480 RepID=A0A9P8QLB0_9HYPO|nr:hypothetical protein Trco_003574 [Trichoderma cornu-damae]